MSGVFDRLLGGKSKVLKRLYLEGEVLDELLGAARSSYPREFGALLEGSFEGDALRIEGYILPRTLTSRDNVVMNLWMLPSTTETIGSIHSHPGTSSTPSASDVDFFRRRGLVHFIMARPYTRHSVAAFDRMGRQIMYSIR